MVIYQLLQTDVKLAPGSGGRGKSQSMGDIRQGPTGRAALMLDALPHHAYRLVDGWFSYAQVQAMGLVIGKGFSSVSSAVTPVGGWSGAGADDGVIFALGNRGSTPQASATIKKVDVDLLGADISSWTNGNITVTANLMDAAGNGAETAHKTLSLDNHAPTVSAVTDTTTAEVTKDAITFTVTFDEAVVGTVSTSSFTATNGQVSSVTKVAGANAYTVLVTPDSGVASGNVALSLVGSGLTDAAGNTISNADLSSKDSQAIDTLADEGDDLAILTTGDADVFTGTVSFSIAGKDNDLNGALTVVNVSDGTNPAVTATFSDGIWRADISQLNAGALTIAVQVTDNAGNTAQTSHTVYSSISKALEDANDGDSLKLAAGNYSLQSEILITKAITIMGFDADTTDANQSVVITNTGGTRSFVVASSIAGAVTISGISVQGGTEAVSVDGSTQEADLDSLSITNSTFTGQQNAGMVIGLNNPASSLGTLSVSGVVFDQSAANISQNTAGHSAAGIMMFGFDGQATISDVTVKGGSSATAASPWYGIHIQGAENAQLAGSSPHSNSHEWFGDGPSLAGGQTGAIALSGVKLVGGFAKSAVAVYNYSDISGISGTNLNLTGASSGLGPVLTVDGIEAGYSLAGWGLNLGVSQVTQVGGEAVSQGAANSVITGSAGNDVIHGGAGGSDSLSGGDGNDALIGGLGNDVLDGGNGVDAAILFSSPAAFVFNEPQLTMTMTSPEGSDTLLNIEQVLKVDGSNQVLATYWMAPFLSLSNEQADRTTQLTNTLQQGDVLVFGGAKDITLEDALTVSTELAMFWGDDTITVRYADGSGPTEAQMTSLGAIGVDNFSVLQA